MGGRGAYSATAKAKEKPKQKGHLHGSQIPDTPEETAKYLGTSVERAKELYASVQEFTGSYYSSIRSAQRGESSDATALRNGDNLEAYIAAAPKWGGGMTYRGIGVSKETAATLMKNWNKGAIIDINGKGTASWSTDKSVSKSFASHGEIHLVFQCRTQSKGTSIKHISHFNHEQEVLVSKNAKYRVVGVPKTSRGYTYIEVEEV